MSRFIWILAYSAAIFTAYKYVDCLNFWPLNALIRLVKESSLGQTVFFAAFVFFVLFYFGSFLSSMPLNGGGKFYAAQITVNDYEAQKRSFTQKKLAELFNTKEYQDYIRHKNLNQTPKVQDLIESEDEL